MFQIYAIFGVSVAFVVFKDEDFDFCFDVQDFNIFWTVKENSVDFLFDVPDNGTLG